MPNKGAERGGGGLDSRQRLSQQTLASMLVAVRAMHMAVGDFFSSGSPHGGDLAAELQCLARQGVVAVQVHFGALDLDHVEHGRLSVVAHALQLAAHLHAGRKLALGNGAHQAFVTRTKGVFHRQVQRGGKAHGLAFQRGFDLGEDVFVATVQVD